MNQIFNNILVPVIDLTIAEIGQQLPQVRRKVEGGGKGKGKGERKKERKKLRGGKKKGVI